MKNDFRFGHASVDDLLYWMHERHRIWERRERGDPYPWTEDVILQYYRFTNVYRQLDRGTVHLTKNILSVDCDPDVLAFNVAMYRCYNRVTTQERLGFIYDWPSSRSSWLSLPRPVFTSAHMVTGRHGEPKIMTFAKTFDDMWNRREEIADLVLLPTLEQAYYDLSKLRFFGVGPFTAYEIVSDFRWMPGANYTDTCSWANIGPGAARGLTRLGLPVIQRSLLRLYGYIGDEGRHPKHPSLPFEMREIEHSLCEFDKYQRVFTGAGAPKGRYRSVR